MSHILTASVSTIFVATALSAQARPIPADTLEPARRCVFTRAPKESTSAFLRRCAEDFVARNGYTSVPPASDSTLRATESIEFGSSWQQVVQRRHNELSPKAESAGCTKTGCAATFRYAGGDACIVRVV